MSMIDPVTLALVKSALDAGALRQVAHANNIANAGTPGYQPFQVIFEERLESVREAINQGSTDALNSMELPAPTLEANPTAAEVSIDSEVAALSRNALHFQALTKALSKQYALIGLALSEGHR